MKKKITLLLTCIIAFAVKSQTLYHSYYDAPYNKHVYEEYYANSYGVKNGLYKKFSEYGAVLEQDNYKNGIEVGKCTLKDDNGQLLLEENYDNDGKYNGQVLRYVNGHIHQMENYRHGAETGHWKIWYTAEDGANAYTQLKEEDYYKDGMRDSVCTEYYLNGKIKTQQLYKGGILNGESKTYNEQGAPLNDGNYTNGNKDGDWTYYDDGGSGEVMCKGKYKDGKNWGQWKMTLDNEYDITTLKSSAVFYRMINYSDDGLWKATDYFITGEKECEETLIQTSPDVDVGMLKVYFKNGKCNLIGKNNSKGGKDSVWTYYFDNGQISSQVKYINNKLDSAYTQYYDNGKIYVQGMCKDNKRVGIWKIWDKNGNLIFMEGFIGSTSPAYGRHHFYKNGQEVTNTYEGNNIVSDDITYSNVWPWPNDNLLKELKQYTQ